MKDFFVLLLLAIISISVTACQQKSNDSLISNKDSSFTLNGAGE